MSGSDERTEQATPRRITKMRAQGIVARSSLAGPALSVGLSLVFALVLARYLDAWPTIFASLTAVAGTHQLTPLAAVRAARAAIFDQHLWTIIMAMWCAVAIGAVACSYLCGSLAFSPSALAPRLSRLTGALGARNIVRFENLLAGTSSSLVVALISSLTLPVLWDAIVKLAHARELNVQFAVLAQACKRCWLLTTCVLCVLAAFEIAVQRRKYAMRIRMTPRELRDERAETESRPETKQRRRNVGARRARSLRIAAIRQATAVITNPEHLAIALRYAPPAIDVPIVVARGADLMAKVVRSAALGFGIPVIESAELAHMLYRRADIDDQIPEECYQAVAAIFAWILRTHGALRRGDEDGA